MDEQRAWIKSRRKKRLRILAAALAFCLLFTTYPDILETLSVFAAGTQDGDGTVYVTGFESLPEEVREQTVPVGTGIEELTLPDALEAVVTVTVEEEAPEEDENVPDKDKNPDDSDPKEDNTVSGAGTYTEENDGADTGAEENGDSTDDGGAGTNTETGTEGTDAETGDETGTEENDAGETEGEMQEEPADGDNTDPAQGDNQTEESVDSTDADQEVTTPDTTEGTDETPAEDTDDKTQEQEQSAPEKSAPEKTPEEQTIEETTLQETTGTDVGAEAPDSAGWETHTVTLPAYAAGNELDIETLEPSPAGESDSTDVPAANGSTDNSTGDDPAATDITDEAPAAGSSTYAAPQDGQPEQTEQTEQSEQTEQVTIGDITWESDPSYDAETEGVYVFTPVLPEGYALSEGAVLPEITVTVKESEQAKALNALFVLLRALPDPEEYLTYDEGADTVAQHEEMIDEEQLAEARGAADAYLEAYPDTDQNVASGADIAGGTAAAINETSVDDTDTDEDTDTATLATLLTRLEALEHIRDTVTDCMDVSCVYHYPQFVKERMNEDEIPELLTLEDLVEDYGIEEPEPAPLLTPARSLARLSRAGYAAAPRAAAPSLHPQTLMFTEDNENNAHTGEPDKDIDTTMTVNSGNHPVEISFTLSELPTQSAYLAVKAYDVDEESGEHDFVYLNDDIYKPMDQFFISSILKDKTYYNSSNIGYLSGTNETWNVTVLKVPLEKLVKGKNVISITVAGGWCVEVDWMQLILDGGAVDTNVQSFSLKLSDVENSGGNVTVHADVAVNQTSSTKYITEYTLTKEATGDALDACFGSAQTKESISFTMDKALDTGIYKITGLLKDPTTEQIRAMDSVSFYFIKNEGVGPKVSHTLTPDTLTNGSVTIRVQAETMPSVTNVTVFPPTQTVTANDKYGFTVSYQINGSRKSFTYYVPVDNIDKVAPGITYKPLTVQEDMPQAEVDALFQASLSASDNRKLADKPLTWTLPANISYLPGTQNVTVKAADAAGNIATETCAVTVTAKPLQLTMKEPAEVSGSKDSFALEAVLTHTGADTITKTGFVWGVMPNPTLEVKNGSVTTSSPVKTKGAALSATATGIASGVTYYARAYATVQSGSQTRTVYSDSSSFGFGVPEYGTFSVSSLSGSTFTISRTGGSGGKQTVYYRTVNGSAIGDTHFTHAAGSLVFADGEVEKTVTVSEKGVTTAYNSKTATSYSNADRTYSLEIYRVEGGGQLDPNKENRSKTRTMTKNGSYTIDRGIYTTDKSVVNVSQTSGTNGSKIADTTSDQGGKTTNVSFLTNRDGNKNYNTSTGFADYYTGEKERTYLRNTAAGWYYRYDLLAYEYDDGYEHAYIGNQPLSDIHYDISSADAAVSGVDGLLWACNFLQGESDPAKHYYFPDSRTGGKENYGYPLNSSGSCHYYGGNNYVRLGFGETCYVYFGSTGKDKDIWYVDGLTSYALVYDEQEPKCIGVAPMAGGDYLPGDNITVALVFDEIVDKTNSTYINSVSINTNVGTLTYKGGADTNVLYFTGQVDTAISIKDTLKVTGINNSGYIKDMCKDSGSAASFSGGSTNVSVDASKPGVTIEAQTSGSLPQHKATVTSSEATVQYAWTKDEGMPAAGWQTADSGVTLTERRGSAGTSETWYLHVLATASSGAVTHQYKSFTFMQPDITAVSVRAGTSASSKDVSDVWKPEKYVVAEYAGAQTSGTKISLNGPQTETKTISAQSGAAAFYVTKNGTYTVTLTDSYNNVITKTIEVKKIDTVAPTAAIQSGSQTGSEVTHNSVTAVITPADTGGSGVAKVEYAWTDSTGTPSSWTALTKAADGSYRAAYNATETARTPKYLHVKVTDKAGNVSSVVPSGPYYVVKAATGSALPTITVTVDDSTWTKSKTLKWTAMAGTGGAAIESVTVPTADAPVTEKTSGTCTVTKNGNYLFAVTDSNGNTVSTKVTVTKIDNEAPELTKVTATGGKTGKVTLEGVTDNLTRVLDEKGNFKEMGGSGVKTREYLAPGESTWTTFTDDSFTAKKNGTYKVILTDSVGNESVQNVEVSGIDATKPKVEYKILSEQDESGSGWYTVDPLQVKLTYSDPAGPEGGSANGVKSVQYKWVTGNTTKPTTGLTSLSTTEVTAGSYTVNLDDNVKTYYLYYKVTDKTGNVKEGFSGKIMKDSYEGSATVSGPTTSVSVETGLAMKLNSLTYGPSGGKVTGGATGEETVLATQTGPDSGQQTYSSSLGYTAKTTGTNYFRFYPGARNSGNSKNSYNWEFYVRKVTFDSQGGSAVDSRLIWHDNNTSAVKCTVTKPDDPTRTGYTFGGWYTDAACTAGKEFNFATTQLRADTTLYAKWTANKYNVTYHLKNPDGTETTDFGTSYQTYTYWEGLTLPEPKWTKQTGFTFDGWYKNSNYTGTKYTAIGKTDIENKTYYGRFKDVEEPKFSKYGLDCAFEGKDSWYKDNGGHAKFITSFSDNNDNNVDDNVTAYIIVDGGAATTQDISQSGSDANYNLLEGEHTYQWKLVDKAGKITLGEKKTYKYDGTKPTAGTITHNAAGIVKDSSGVTWLCGKEEVALSVPVTDALSGLDYVEYSLYSPDNSSWNSVQTSPSLDGIKNNTTELKFTNSGNDYKKKIKQVRCSDMAGNLGDYADIKYNDSQTVSTNQEEMGIIVEDNAPRITILADRETTDVDSTKAENAGIEIDKEKYYNSAPKLYVNVTDDETDDGNGQITSGLKSVTWKIDKIDNGAVQNAGFGANTLTEEHDFTIFALDGLTGVVQVTVTATDHAGNETTETKTVKIKSKEDTPEPKIDYINEKLTGLKAGDIYKIRDTNGEEKGIPADESGCIKIEGEWFGKTVELRKKENGTTTLDSDKKDVKLEARPAKPEIILKQDETIKDKRDGIIGMAEGVSGSVLTTLEYSTDGGENWKSVTELTLTDGKITGCAAGAWRFRVPACNTAPYGETKEITITAGKALTVSFEENGGSEVAEITDLSWHDEVNKPEDPVREGYAFEDWYKDASCSAGSQWHFKDESTGGTPDKMEADTTLYAKWDDTAAPALSVVLMNPVVSGNADGEQWYNSLSAAITYSDNEGVKALYVGVDLDSEAKKQDNSYIELSLNGVAESEKGEDGSTWYLIYHDSFFREGKHTYTFRAVDAAGNETTVELTARLDITASVMGTASYGENPANLWDWIIGKDSLLITVPLTDYGQDGEPGSGVETVEYTLTTADTDTDSDVDSPDSGVDSPDSGVETVDDTLTTADTGTDSDADSSDSGADSPDSDADSPGSTEVVATGTAVVKEAEDGTFTAEITVLADFKGKVKVSAIDKAGNLAAEKTLGVDGSGKEGIIVEDNAPDICFSIGGGEVAQTYYDTALAVDISVDDTGSAKEQDGTDQTKTATLITGGIASVTCTITDGSKTVTYTPDTKYKEAMKESDSFAIPADKLFTGINTITVTAVDNAGNKAEKSITVKVKIPDEDEEDDTSEGSASGDSGIDTPEDEKSSETPEVTLPQPEEKPEKPQRKEKSEKNPEEKPQPEGTDAPDQGGTRPAQTKEPQTVLAFLDDGKIVVLGEPVSTGSVDGMNNTSTVLKLEDGAVIVTVVCKEQKCTAGVADTVAVANAVLTPEQIQLVADGETIEIRIDVKDISDKAPQQDKDVIERGIKENRKEQPDLTIGMYIDISMFIKIGTDDWNAITRTEEPIDVAIGVPETLKVEGRKFTIIRSHDGEYTLLPDIDDNPDTITISTNLFSAYAIAYEQADGNAKCGLCHICPTFLGICCFIWLTVILAVLMIVVIVVWRKRKGEKEKQEE